MVEETAVANFASPICFVILFYQGALARVARSRFRYPGRRWVMPEARYSLGLPRRQTVADGFSPRWTRASAWLFLRRAVRKDHAVPHFSGYLRPQQGRVLVDGVALPKRGACPVQLIGQHPERMVDPHAHVGRFGRGGSGAQRLVQKLWAFARNGCRHPHELFGRRAAASSAFAPSRRDISFAMKRPPCSTP